MSGAVYLATADVRPGQFKVGFSKNPDGRRCTLAAKLKSRVRMPVAIWFEDERCARKLERDALYALCRMEIHADGEWFFGTLQTGIWGIYKGLMAGAVSYVDNGPTPEAPLLEWGLGWNNGRKTKRYDWRKINAALQRIERLA